MARVSQASWGRHPTVPWPRLLGQAALCALCVAAGVMLSPRAGRDHQVQSGKPASGPVPVTSMRPGAARPAPAPTMPPGGYPQVVASHDLAATTVITDSAAVTASFVVTGSPLLPQRGTLSSLQALDASINAAHGGRYLTRAVPAGTPLRQDDLADLGGRTGASLSLSMPVGFEAVSVSVPPLQSADGTVVAGDHVDVLLTLSTDQLVDSRPPSQPPGPQETQQLLQNVTVARANPPIYTLLVRPQDALLLKYVKDSQNALLELALRSGQNPTTPPLRTAPILPAYFTHHLASAFVSRPAAPPPPPSGVTRRLPPRR